MKTHIDYTKINKSLIYKERTNLEDFIQSNDLNAIIIENMQEIDFLMYEEFELHALACMNEAYYYCTLIMLEKFPMWRWSFFCDSPKKLGSFRKHKYPPAVQFFYEETYQVIVLSIVNILLQHVSEDWQRTQEKFLGKIEDCLNEDKEKRDSQGWLRSKNLYSIYEKLSRGTAQEIVLPPTEFSPRYIGDEDIPLDTWVKDIDYTIEAIKSIPTEKEKLHILNNLIKQLKSYIKIANEDGYYNMSPKYNAALNDLKELRDNIHLEETSSQILKNQSPMLSNIIAHAEKRPVVNGNEVSELKAENTKLRNQVKKLEEELKNRPKESPANEDANNNLKEDIDKLKQENEGLEREIEDLEKRKGIGTRKAALLVRIALSNVGGLPPNRENAWPLITNIWGSSMSLSQRRLKESVKEYTIESLAILFDSVSPKIANIIREEGERILNTQKNVKKK